MVSTRTAKRKRQRQRRHARAVDKVETLAGALAEAGFRQCNPWHFQLSIGSKLLDYWPTRDKWRIDGRTSTGTTQALMALVARERMEIADG